MTRKPSSVRAVRFPAAYGRAGRSGRSSSIELRRGTCPGRAELLDHDGRTERDRMRERERVQRPRSTRN
jgi:hypothetical protein